MRIWIDLDNSPHVLLFTPVIRELQRSGVDFVVTVRDFSQTQGLAEQRGLKFTTVGTHSYSSSLARKGINTLYRAWELRRFIARYPVAAAVSHGVRALVVAARSLGVPVLTLDDYEFSSNRLTNRLSNRVLMPEVIPESDLVAQGLNLQKLIRYPGLKEEVYVYDFRPDESVLEKLGLDTQRVIVTVRPPATWAHYHGSLGDLLFRALLRRLEREPGIQVVLSARTEAQELELRRHYRLPPEKFRIHSQAVDGLSLMWFSDVVFSGGGTMVREAALLGVITYSIFGGRMGAADKYLASRGKLRLLRDPDEIESLLLPSTRTQRPAAPSGRSIAPFIAQEILRFAGENSRTHHEAEEFALKQTQNSRVNP